MKYEVIDRSSGQVAIVLHGLGSDRHALREFAQALPGLDIVLPDLPGHGDSAALNDTNTLATYAHAVERLRVELAPTGGIHLVGHSLGASIALAYGALYGDKLSSLTLLNPVSTPENLGALLAQLYYRIGALLPDRAARWWLASRPAVWLSDMLVLRTKNRARRRQILEQDYRTYRRVSTRAIAELSLSYAETPFNAYADAISAYRVNTLVITGERDLVAPPAGVAALAERIQPGVDALVIPGAGHLWVAEEPLAAAALLTDFYAESRELPPTPTSR